MLVEAVVGALAIRSNAKANVAFAALEGSKAGVDVVVNDAPTAAELLCFAILAR